MGGNQGETAHVARGQSYSALLDAHRWSGYQVFVVLLASLAILLDGFDNQALGFALPAIMADMRLPKTAFGPALAASQFGVLVGAVCGGLLGDRFGRKVALIGSVAIFGAATVLIASGGSVTALAVWRFIAGIGLGAAFPNVAAFAAEFTPGRRRGLAVTVGIVSVPLGGALGGVVAAWLLPAYGWRALFISAGSVTLAVAALLLVVLPETVGFLLTRRTVNVQQIARICRRMDMAVPATASQHGVVSEQPPGGTSVLVSREFVSDTLWLWVAFFFCLAAVYIVFGWLPTLLVSNGLSLSTASIGLSVFNAGGVIAALVTGWLIGRVGSRTPMLMLSIMAMAMAAVFMVSPEGLTSNRAGLLCVLALEGACVNGVQTTLYALAAQMYPTGARATGVGAAAGLGRFGAILSSIVGGVAIEAGGTRAFHGIIAASMAIVAVALGLIGRHMHATGRPDER